MRTRKDGVSVVYNERVDMTQRRHEIVRGMEIFESEYLPYRQKRRMED